MIKPQQQILAWLLQGGLLSVQEAFRLFHTTELRKVIDRLRKRGYEIITCWESGSRDGRTIRYKRYSIKQETI